jgi:hypothetical protein
MSKYIEPMNDAETPQAMRIEIARLSRYDPLVRRVFDMAEYQGLSGEDRYTILAFHAMKMFKATQEKLMHLAAIQPREMVVVDPYASVIAAGTAQPELAETVATNQKNIDATNRQNAEVLAAARDGFVWVPMEPTEEMIEAAESEDGRETAIRVWDMMIAASP